MPRSFVWRSHLGIMRAVLMVILFFAGYELFDVARNRGDGLWWLAKWLGIGVAWLALNLFSLILIACWRAWRQSRVAR